MRWRFWLRDLTDPFNPATERQVLVVTDVHLAIRSAPALLKTVEEPPPATVFVLLCDTVPPELVTIASRCAEIRFPPISSAVIERWLAAKGVDPDRVSVAALGDQHYPSPDASRDADSAKLDDRSLNLD